MKRTRILANLLAVAFTLGAGAASQAMSTLVSITMEPQWPTNSQPGSLVLYTVTVTRAGQGNLVVQLGSLGLPQGATAAFSLNPVRFTGRQPTTLTSTLAVICTNVTPVDAYPFIVAGTDKRAVITVTNQPGGTWALTGAAQPQAPPTLALDQLSPTSMRLRGLGASGQTYQIQSTPSLSQPAWTVMGSSTADGNGRFIYLDNNPNPPRMLFYRAVLPVGTPVQTP